MSTLQTTPRITPTFHTGLKTGLVAVGVLIAIAVAAAILLVAGKHTTNPTVRVVTNNDTSAAYAPPHRYFGSTVSTSVPTASRLTPNNQNSSAYSKAELYKPAR
jgi:hypothetical protein